MNGQPTQKRCPQCQTVVDILTQQCPGCGHWFRTQFQQQPINQTTVIPPMGGHVINAPATYVQPRQEHSILAAFLLAMFLPFLAYFYNKQVWKGIAFIFAGILYFWGILGWYTTLAMAIHPALVLIPSIAFWTAMMTDVVLCAAALKVVPKLGDWSGFGGGYAPRGSWQYDQARPYLMFTWAIAGFFTTFSLVIAIFSSCSRPVGSGALDDNSAHTKLDAITNDKINRGEFSDPDVREAVSVYTVKRAVVQGLEPSRVRSILGAPDDVDDQGLGSNRVLVWTYSYRNGHLVLFFKQGLFLDDAIVQER